MAVRHHVLRYRRGCCGRSQVSTTARPDDSTVETRSRLFVADTKFRRVLGKAGELGFDAVTTMPDTLELVA
jgi:hypothetical protein